MPIIMNEPELFDAAAIARIEKKYDAKYVCETCIKTKSDGWLNTLVAIFYCAEAHPISKSRYFGLCFVGNNLMIINGQTAVDEPIQALQGRDGYIVYSRYRHDMRETPDGSAMMDGGRDYVRCSVGEGQAPMTLKIVDGVLQPENTKEEFCIGVNREYVPPK